MPVVPNLTLNTNSIITAADVQGVTTTFVFLAIELERGVYIGLGLDTQLGGVGKLELQPESFRQWQRSLIC